MGKTAAGLADKVKQQAREGFEAVRDTVTKTTEHTDAEKPEGDRPVAGSQSADLSRGLGTS
jgi:hypothetical protein